MFNDTIFVWATTPGSSTLFNYYQNLEVWRRSWLKWIREVAMDGPVYGFSRNDTAAHFWPVFVLKLQIQNRTQKKNSISIYSVQPRWCACIRFNEKNDAGTRKLSGLPAGEVLLRERAKKKKKKQNRGGFLFSNDLLLGLGLGLASFPYM